MRICPTLALILALAACEHASTTTAPSTPLAVPAPAPPRPEAPVAPAPPPTAAAMVEPARIAPAARPAPPDDKCRRYRMTRAAPKWAADCERPRVTHKPAPARPEASQP